MKIKRTLGGLALAAALTLSGCAGEMEPVPLNGAAGASTGTLAYVPLDDRPVNTDRVEYLAESLGYTVSMPDAALCHTCLDHQARNPNGTAYGDRGALLEWVLDQEARGCDNYILSLDQLLSGGLVNSRSDPGGPVTLSGGETVTAIEALDRLLKTLGSDGGNRVYLLDTVMRLAPTVGYDGWDLEGYEALRAYGMAARPTLVGESLTPENIAAGYALGADGAPVDWRECGLTSRAEVERYLDNRTRKLALTDHALCAAENLPNVQFLIGVDDSAPSASIQTNEIAYLKWAVEGRGAVLSGADEDGMLAVCRMYAEWEYDGNLPTVWVRYFGGGEAAASSDYDHQPLREIVDAHLDYLGLGAEEGPEADLQVLVLTIPRQPERMDESMEDLLAALEENEKNGVPTVLMDAAKNSCGTAFQEKLVKKAELGALFGYAGYYDLANATGIALSNGAARWMRLSDGTDRSADQERAFLRTLADSLLKDLCYKNDAKNRLTAWVREEQRGNPDNFDATGLDGALVLKRLEETMADSTRAVLKNLAGSSFIYTLEPYGELRWPALTLTDYALPWNRVFEIRVDLGLGDFPPARRGLFGG